MNKKILLVLFALFSYACNVSADIIHVVVTSTKGLKTDAARDAFQQNFPKDTIEVVGFKCNTDTPPQPVGIDAGESNAEKRIKNLKEQEEYATYCQDHPAHCIVSFENAVVPNEDDKTVYDACTVVFAKKIGEVEQTGYLMSDQKVFFPWKFYKKSQGTGFQKTCGKFIVDDFTKMGAAVFIENYKCFIPCIIAHDSCPDIKHDNWMEIFEGEGRKKDMKATLEILLKDIPIIERPFEWARWVR